MSGTSLVFRSVTEARSRAMPHTPSSSMLTIPSETGRSAISIVFPGRGMFINILLHSLPMKTRTAYITLETKKRIDFVNITSRVEDEVGKSGVKEGIVLINPMHITASVYVNDAESGQIGRASCRERV